MIPSHQALEELSDAEVMLQAQWGSERAFAELYGRHYRRLLDFFYGLSRDVQTAEDLCHETFLRLWQLRVRYRPSGSFPAYLFTIARHIWMERRRQTRKEWRLGTAWSADDGADAVRFREFDQQAVEGADFDVLPALKNLSDHGYPFFSRKKRVFFGIVQDGDHDSIENIQSALNDIDMPIRNGIK